MEETRNEVMQGSSRSAEESFKSGSVQYIDSREVAELVGKKHADLIRDIKRYRDQLSKVDPKSKIAFSDFFIESSYDVEGQSRRYPCYLVTLKGCEFIAHKLTGEKGTIFTATYINRFHEMKGEIAENSSVQIDKLADIVKEYIIQQDERDRQRNRQQMEFNQMFIDRLEKLENGVAMHKANPYCVPDNGRIKSRKRELYELTAKVAELCGNSHTKILHYMYRALEEDLGIVLDSYKSVYRSETGKQDAGMVEIIAANDQIYETAMEMNKAVIERKQIYG